MTNKITIETHVVVSPEVAWDAFTSPASITQWNFASPEWCCPSAEVDLRKGGKYTARMEARDGSMGFDFSGTYDLVDPPSALILRLDDGRLAHTTFEPDMGGTRVRTVFDPDSAHPAEMQKEGWQAILDTYAAFLARREKAR
ncbi:SRPBCC domain-containing protein [Thalassococcus sp. S3]|uniref:SRPBCC domain-containing protein n=1 Tax=Thalassococcus sp. S3 TaxID=2017482 RepID=UPI001023F62E|nr:SRPBCC domain-containing protein [Thalassococcus sp. S3]QBF32638.1 activator of HSP90 ATPase [Thalassococcus sp. S3]